MTQSNYETQQIWTTGRRGCVTPVLVLIYPEAILAIVNGERITECQTKKALRREFPRHTFYFDDGHNDNYVHYFAARWTEDGLNQ